MLFCISQVFFWDAFERVFVVNLFRSYYACLLLTAFANAGCYLALVFHLHILNLKTQAWAGFLYGIFLLRKASVAKLKFVSWSIQGKVISRIADFAETISSQSMGCY